MPLPQGYPTVEVANSDDKLHRRKIAEQLQRMNQGKFNCTNSITLAVSATTTTLKDPRIGANSLILLMPLTADAAAALAAGIYFTNLAKGVATINHASSAHADQTFTVLILA